jgi:hypothetical protein
MSTAPDSNHFSPGFDFLQDLVKNAGAALPNIGQWIAPTINPEEIAKRIEELRTVQFWLEQNARMLGATIQALEVQRMTLSTLQSMNVQIDDLRKGLSIPLDASRSAETDAGSVAKSPAGPAAKAGAAAGGAASAGSVDPMQWWGALTKQFTELAASAVKDTAKYAAVSAAKAPAGSAIGPGLEGADKTSKKTAAVPAAVAPQASAPLRKRRGGPVR